MSNTFKERAERLVSLVQRKGVESILLFPGVELYYFTGFKIGLSERLSAALILFEDEPVFFVPELEADLRGQKPWIRQVVTWKDHENAFKLLAEMMSSKGLENAKIGICDSAPWGWIKNLEAGLPSAKFIDISDVVNSLRMVKSKFELDYIRKACETADKALIAAFQSLREGITEADCQPWPLVLVAQEKRHHVDLLL